MKELMLIQKILPNTDHIINNQAKVADYINPNIHWNLPILRIFYQTQPLKKYFSSIFLPRY